MLRAKKTFRVTLLGVKSGVDLVIRKTQIHREIHKIRDGGTCNYHTNLKIRLKLWNIFKWKRPLT